MSDKRGSCSKCGAPVPLRRPRILRSGATTPLMCPISNVKFCFTGAVHLSLSQNLTKKAVRWIKWWTTVKPLSLCQTAGSITTDEQHINCMTELEWLRNLFRIHTFVQVHQRGNMSHHFPRLSLYYGHPRIVVLRQTLKKNQSMIDFGCQMATIVRQNNIRMPTTSQR